MRKLKKYTPVDDFDMPKSIDLTRYTAVLLRQSDEGADENNPFSREAQLKLIPYAMRLRGETTDARIRIYDEGAGTSGQKRIDQREHLNRLYNDIKAGLMGSVVIILEDRLFRDKYQTQSTTFIELLAEHNVLLFVRQDHRCYDCSKPSDRENLLKKLIESRSYLDNHVLGRMVATQRDKALRGLYDGRMIPPGFVIDKRVIKRDQKYIVYEPWANIVNWLFVQLKELDSLAMLSREIERMPYLFPDQSIDDMLAYIFKVRMNKVPGGYKPSSSESVQYLLTNVAYIGHWVLDDAIVRYDNHPAIIDTDLFMWVYHKLVGCDLEGQPVPGLERRRLQAPTSGTPQAVLKYILTAANGDGLFYVARQGHDTEYIKQTPSKTHKQVGRLYRHVPFAIQTRLLDTIFIERVKAMVVADPHIAEHVKISIEMLQQEEAKVTVSLEDQLKQVQLQIKKKRAVLEDKILEMQEEDKIELNAGIQKLKGHEAEILKAQGQATRADLRADYVELADVLRDIPGELDACSIIKKQKLARLITQRVMIEELSIHWLQLTIHWVGPLSVRPDVCLIWRRDGKRNPNWTEEDDAIIRDYYPTADKWEILEAMPQRTMNMIFMRAKELRVERLVGRASPGVGVPKNVSMGDIMILGDYHKGLELIEEVARRNEEAAAFWLYSADITACYQELAKGENIHSSDWGGKR